MAAHRPAWTCTGSIMTRLRPLKGSTVLGFVVLGWAGVGCLTLTAAAIALVGWIFQIWPLVDVWSPFLCERGVLLVLALGLLARLLVQDGIRVDGQACTLETFLSIRGPRLRSDGRGLQWGPLSFLNGSGSLEDLRRVRIAPAARRCCWGQAEVLEVTLELADGALLVDTFWNNCQDALWTARALSRTLRVPCVDAMAGPPREMIPDERDPGPEV